jgi:hypothetical protein
MPARKSIRLPWIQLGWGPNGRDGAPAFEQGPLSLVIVAPWCPDCEAVAPGLKEAIPSGHPLWLVGEFASRAEVDTWADRHGLPWPRLYGETEKSEASRARARFRQLREAWGDSRHWGLPLWIHGRIRNGQLLVEDVTWPA